MQRRKERKPFRRVADPPATLIREEFLDAGDRPMETNFRYWMEHVLHWHALLFAVVAILWIGTQTLGF